MAEFRENRTKMELLDGVKDIVSSRKCNGRSTVRYTTSDGTERIKYHDTVVLEVRKDGSIRLDSGGFRTVTTKERINTYQNIVSIWQAKGEWSVHTGEAVIPFTDGMEFRKNGQLIGGKRAASKADAEVNRKRRVARKIARYCTALKKEIAENGVPRPSNGDCFLCREAMKPTCLQSHLDEVYIHGTLVFNAVKWAGYNGEAWFRLGYFGDVVNCVRRYLRFHMELAN